MNPNTFILQAIYQLLMTPMTLTLVTLSKRR